MSLPEAVLKCGVRAVFLCEPSNFKNPLDSKYDFCAVRLQKKPPVEADRIPKWVPFSAPGVVSYSSIGGKAPSGFVTGEGDLVVDQTKGEGVFVEKTGEPGHSGTLLFGFNTDGSSTMIGVYLGVVDSLNPRMRTRGRVCLMPDLKDLTACELNVDPPQTLIVTDRMGSRRCDVSVSTDKKPEVVLKDGEDFPGVIIKKTILYHGSFDYGSFRAK